MFSNYIAVVMDNAELLTIYDHKNVLGDKEFIT